MSFISKMPNAELKLRVLDSSDMEDLYQWRNHPFIRRKCFNSRPLSRKEHERWFKRKSQSRDTTIYIGHCQGQKIGMVRFDKNGSDRIKVSVMVSPDFIGRNLGSKLIQSGVRKIMKTQSGKIVIAEIKQSNIASIKAFKKAGFKMSHLIYTFE